ncbi:MAG: MurR/RpiR family transcriptional regulator [Clostridiaceae bacterium]|nr:MurR/RpiR family transcriptional regulator [Eubacteriales bacterium]
MKLLMKMRQMKDLSPSERHIVEYIFENIHEVVNIGIVQLAQKTNTSTSTLKRLCSKLDVDSYIDFRLQLSMELSEYLHNSILQRASEPVGRYDSIEEIIDKVSNQNAKSILDSSGINAKEAYVKVIDMMMAAKRTDFYGIGPSNLVAADAALKCMRLGMHATAYNNHLEMLMNAKNARPGQLAILISYTGETDEILAVANELVVRSVPMVSLTSLSENSLKKICPINLFVQASESWDRLGGMSSRISTLSVIDILFTALINRDYERYTRVANSVYVGKRLDDGGPLDRIR